MNYPSWGNLPIYALDQTVQQGSITCLQMSAPKANIHLSQDFTRPIFCPTALIEIEQALIA